MRVLVTRPQPGAGRTARRLAERGHEAVVMPLQEIRGLPAALPAGGFAAVAVTSANALRHAPAALVAGLAGLPVYAVGAETARAAIDAGFAEVAAGPGNAAGLAAQLARILRPGCAIAYPCGRIRKPALEAALAAAGFAVTAIETYETVDLPPRGGQPDVDAVLLHAAGAARRLAAAFPPPALSGCRFLCLSADVAAALPSAWRERAVIAVRPDEPALLATL